MNPDTGTAALQFADARLDVMAMACLVANMSQGVGHHGASEDELGKILEEEIGASVPIVTSAGALVEALHYPGAKRVAVITPSTKPLIETVCGYIEHEGYEVVDSISLEAPDNLEVGRLHPQQLIELAQRVDTSQEDALVLGACVQMPSLPVLQQVQDQFNIPVLSPLVATAWQIQTSLGLDAVASGAGNLLTGQR